MFVLNIYFWQTARFLGSVTEQNADTPSRLTFTNQITYIC